MAKRMLTPEEKSQVVKERCSEAMIAHPDKMIFVRVEDETDENGEALIWVHLAETLNLSCICSHPPRRDIKPHSTQPRILHQHSVWVRRNSTALPSVTRGLQKLND